MIVSHFTISQYTIFNRIYHPISHHETMPKSTIPRRSIATTFLRISLTSIFAVCIFAGLSAVYSQEQNPKDEAYLFAYYTDKNANKNGLHFACSKDGYEWEQIGGEFSFLKCDFGNWGSEKKLRDPFVLRDGEGYWHCLWTLNFNTPRIAHAKSKDLIHWERHHYIPVIEGMNGDNCWAPEMVYDPKSGEFIVFWASNIDKKGNRLYSARTKDFKTFGETKLFFDPGEEVIDASISKVDDEYYLFYQSKADRGRYKLSIAAADTPGGPYKHLRDAEFDIELVGPSVYRLDSGDWLLHAYNPRGGRYETLRTNDFKEWKIETEKTRFPDVARQGSFARCSVDIVESLKNHVETTARTNRRIGEADRALPADRFAGTLEAVVKIETAKTKKIGDELLGVFFEDINYAADGGLYAELVQNRDFEYTSADRGGWKADSFWNFELSDSAEGKFEIRTENPIHPNNPHYLALEVTESGTGGISVSNEGYGGIVLKKGDKYLFSAFARSQTPEVEFRVRLVDEKGVIVAESSPFSITAEWKKHETTLIPDLDCASAKLVLVLEKKGKIDLDMISLFPEKTFKNRKNGLRADLAQAIADLNPKFVRFPGGCLVHGRNLENMYLWENTVGPLEARKPQPNIWGYHQSAGLGYYEYFQFCEDIGAASLPVLPAAVCCQNAAGTGQCGIPLHDMNAYIQTIFDLVEFANGQADTKWGGLRAEMGHPEPFGLKYIGIGNEDIISDAFEERFTLIFNAMKEKHPEITIIGTVGPFHAGTDYEEGWNIARKLEIPIVDEHYYVAPGWMIENQDYYDKYERGKTQVYLGEYASRGNTLYNALAEAVYLNGLERNGDVVRMSSYAPLLAREGNTQWNPDLIYFNNREVKPTVNYQVQKLYGKFCGDEYLVNGTSVTGIDPGLKKRVSSSVVRNSETGTISIRLVNVLPVAVDAKIQIDDFPGFSSKEIKAVKHVLEGNPGDRGNRPTESKIKVSKEFPCRLPPHSLSVIVIKSE